MYKNCKTEQSAARQRQIEQYLLKFMQQQRFEDISISGLCDGLGIPRKAFYRYFSGKQGALHALIDHALADMDAFALSQYRGSTSDRRQKAEFFFLYWQGQKKLLDAIEHCGLWEVLMDRATEYSLSRLPEVQKTGTSIPNEHDYLVRSSIYGIFAILQLLYRRNFPISALEAASMSQFVFTELWSGDHSSVYYPANSLSSPEAYT